MKRLIAPVFRVLSIGLLGVAVLTACGGGHSEHRDTTAKPPAGADFNAADVQFARDMIVHHNGAISMAEQALSRGTAKVRPLAERIKAAQAPEITTMSGWLRTWGEEVPSGDEGHHGMPGMASTDELAALEKASGAEADRLFLQLMVAHHEGALTMSEEELEKGENADAKKLAAAIVTAQRAEIAEMRELLG